MAISFREIPTNTRVPKSYFEVDPRNPIAGGMLNRMLLVGTRNNTDNIPDSAPNNRPIAVSSGAAADDAFGQGSQLALMIRAALDVAPQLNLWAMAAPISTPTARQVPFVLSYKSGVTSLGNGLALIDINGVVYRASAVGLADFDALGSEIASVINSNANAPYSAAYDSSTDTLTFTARTAGESANNDTISFTDFAAGVDYAQGTVTPGTGSPEIDVTSANAVQSAVSGDEPFDMVVIPSALDDPSGAIASSNTTVLNAFETQMSRRWGPASNAYGHILTSFKGSTTDVTTLMNGRNNQYETIVCYEANSPTPEYIVSAVYGARVFASLVADPARPATGLGLRGVVGPNNPANIFTEANRNAILNAGGATLRYIQGGAEIERATTTRRNIGNADDFNWFDIQTPFTVVVCNRAFRNFMAANYATAKLADDGNITTLSGNVVTPSIVKAQLSNVYRQLVAQGLVENAEAFIADPNFVVERNVPDRNRLDISLPLNLVNQARVFAVLVNFQV